MAGGTKLVAVPDVPDSHQVPLSQGVNNMWLRLRTLVVIGSVAVLPLVATNCSNSTATGPTTVSLAGSYTLKSFTEGGQDLSQAATGTALLTATTYKVNIAFVNNAAAAIADSGTYSAKTDGTFSESSLATGAQSTGTYTNVNGLWSVNVTSQGIPITQTWQKQ